ncbi:TolC family protein [Verrucomicrobiaceae bacterium R5-34]|nr:TolC family protein [Verrucomicrobiaceae bacterium R5-34]
MYFPSFLPAIPHSKMACAALTAALFTLSAPFSAGAESLVVSLGSIPDRIKKQNPDLAAARYRIAEAYGRLRQSGRHSNPQLELGASHNKDFRERAFSVGVARKFPVTNRLALEKAVSLSAVRQAEAEVRDVERRLVEQSRLITVKILALRNHKQLLQKQLKVCTQLAEYISNAAAKGEGSILDAGQAKLEAAQLGNQLRQLDAEAATLMGNLKPLLGMTVNHSLVVTGHLPEISTPSRSVDPNDRPDLKAAKIAIQQADHAAALERAKSRDDIEVSISGSIERSEDAPEGYETETTVGIGLKIPLPLYNKNEGAIEAADARKQRKEKEAQALAHHIRHEAATAHREMQEWAKLAREVSDTLLPLAQAQADLADEAYRNGQGDLQANLRTREQLLRLASSRLDALREFHLARVRYQSALAR